MRVLSLIVLSFFFVACSGGSRQLENRVTKLEGDLKDVRSLLAQQRTQLASFQRHLRGIRGQVERLDFETETELGENLSDLEQKYLSLRRRVPPPALVPIVELENDESYALKIAGDEQRLLQNALTRLREANYAGALESLGQLSQVAASDETLLRTQFWTGVAGEGSNDLKRAVASFAAISKNYPEHERAAVSLLRLGSVFTRLKDFEAAALTFRKVTKLYAGTPSAKVAAEKLKDLR